MLPQQLLMAKVSGLKLIWVKAKFYGSDSTTCFPSFVGYEIIVVVCWTTDKEFTCWQIMCTLVHCYFTKRSLHV